MYSIRDKSDFEINRDIVKYLGLSSEHRIERPVDQVSGDKVEYFTRRPVPSPSLRGMVDMVLVSHIVDYCNCASDSFPLIEANRISLQYREKDDRWEAGLDGLKVLERKPLKAAMCVLLISLARDED